MPELTIKDAKDIAADWVARNSGVAPGFAGAFIAGSTNWKPDHAPFPTTSDVDIMMVHDGTGEPVHLGKFMYQNVLIDVGAIKMERIDTAEKILEDHRIAGSFSKNCVVADPTGRLTELQSAVSRDYASRKWVLKRIQHAEELSVGYYLRAVAPEQPEYAQVTSVAFGTAICADLLLTAGLTDTTIRKKHAAARELLHSIGRPDAYEMLLELFGCAQMSGDRVSYHLDQLESVFDTASEIDKPGYRFATDISQTARPIAIDGSRELIEQGNHRDAVFYIVETFARCMNIFDEYGSGDTVKQHSAAFKLLLADLGIGSFEARKSRAIEVELKLLTIRKIAESMIEDDPRITY